MAVALGKNDNAAAARDRPALRGLQAIVLPALRFLDRPTHAFKNAPCQHDCLKARDISELFRGSLASFHKDYIGLTGTKNQTNSAANAFKALYKVEPETEQNSTLVGHTSAIYLVGPSRNIVRHYPPGITAGELAGELRNEI